MRFLIVFFILLFSINSFSQNEYKNIDYSYKTTIPHWLDVKETNDSTTWGGLFPEIDGITNALLIQGLSKNKFNSFNDFKYRYLTGNKFGDTTLYSNQHIWYGQNEIIEIENGFKQKVFIFWDNKIYHNQYILLETSTSYLWIQFTSTPKTYDLNIDKFNQFIKTIILN